MKTKDVAKFTIAILGVLFSAATVYFTFFKQEDQLRAFLDGEIRVRAVKQNNENIYLAVTAQHQLTIINSGNRAALISNIGLYIAVPDREDSRDCESKSTRVNYDLKPLQMKAGEISQVKVTLTAEGLAVDQWGETLVDQWPDDREKSEYFILLCVGFKIALLGDDPSEITVPMFIGTFANEDGHGIYKGDVLHRDSDPIILAEHQRIAF